MMLRTLINVGSELLEKIQPITPQPAIVAANPKAPNASIRGANASRTARTSPSQGNNSSHAIWRIRFCSSGMPISFERK
jgi:hypothetical protein